MIVRHFNIKAPRTQPPQDEGWEQTWAGYYIMTKCISQQKRLHDAERDRAIRAEGMMTEPEFEQDCFLSILADIKRKQVNMFELGAGWGRICLELAGVIDYRVIPLTPVSYRCLAVEGEPTHYLWTKEHFEIQNINGIIIHGAVSNKNGSCLFNANPSPESCYGQAMQSFITPSIIPSIRNLYNIIKKRTIKIPEYTIDHLIKKYKLDHVDIIDMDIQGAEYKVVSGPPRALRMI